MGVALREECVFTGTADAICEVEADEAVLKKVPIYDQGVRTGTVHFAAFCMRQRGSRKTVAYMMQPKFVPVAESGKPSALPPPCAEELRPWIERHVGDFVVFHTDGARAYGRVIQSLTEDKVRLLHDAVDHTAYQWTRFQRHPGRVKVTCGTQFAEAFWNVVKHHCVPRTASANTASLETYLLSLMWRMHVCGDPVADLGQAVRKYILEFAGDPYKNDPHLRETEIGLDNGENVEDPDEQEDSDEALRALLHSSLAGDPYELPLADEADVDIVES
jgi:hypothetical protein